MIGGMMKEVVLRALGQYPVFTVRDIANVLDKSRAYSYLVAHRLKKAGAIREVEKGKYSTEPDPLLVASWVVWPSYISSWAALSFYKLTDQLPFTIHVVTTRKRKKKTLRYGNAKIEFIKFKPSAFFGFNKITHQRKEVFMAEPEKALVDAIVARKMSLPEAVEIVKRSKKSISKAKLYAYARISLGLAKKLKAMLND